MPSPSGTNLPLNVEAVPAKALSTWAVAGVIALASVIVLAYLPGLPGTFLFDDYSNLPLLGAFGGVHDWPSLLLYATSGIADPTGRPVSQLSFLLDARNWPADPLPFKRTNIAIHVLNALLLVWALHRLGLRVGMPRKRSISIALLAAALWALHPLHVSTVLYIIQRHAQLVLLFFLICTLAWDYAIGAFQEGRRAKAILLSALCIFAWVLACLSKSNGILIPLLLGLVYLHCRRATSPQPGTATGQVPLAAKALFASALLAALAVVIVVSAASIAEPGSARPWAYWDRVLTQPRALFDYLGLLLIPRIGTAGIFTDGYTASTGLWSPPTTILALFTLVAIVAFSARQLGKHPLALALGFFLVGHLLESGFVNLELFYEHRNYLPSALLFWALASWVSNASGSLTPRRTGAFFAVGALLTVLTALRAASWGSPEQIATLAERHAAGSERLELLLTSTALRQGRPDIAAARAHSAMEVLPNSALLAYNLLTAECAMGNPTREAADLASNALRQTRSWDRNLYHWVSERVGAEPAPTCDHFTSSSLAGFAAALRESPIASGNADALQDILTLQAEIALAANEPQKAETLFGEAVAALPRYDAALWIAQRAEQLGATNVAAEVFTAARRCLPTAALAPWGMGRIHASLLSRYPVHEPQRIALEQRLALLAAPSEGEVNRLCGMLAGDR